MRVKVIFPILDSGLLPVNTLNEVLTRHTMADLKSLMSCLPGVPTSGTKDVLASRVQKSLSGEGLHEFWNRLDETQRLAVAEAVYAVGGLFYPEQFQAKYGRLPVFHIKSKGLYASRPQPTPLALLLYYRDEQYRLPDDIREQLKTFVPEPAPYQLRTIEALPEKAGESPLVLRNTENDAVADLHVLLRLVDQGKIQVSDKTAVPGNATLQLLRDRLAGGDFYAESREEHQWAREIGAMKAFSWPLLLQAAGLVQRNGARLGLSPAGMKALTASPADVIGRIWKKWLDSSLFDEFSRIYFIKGQKSKGRVMTAVPHRRAAISDMLELYPAGRWISVDDFSRSMLATDNTFEVTHNPWSLFVGDRQYGSLGYDGHHGWEILQLRYLLCFLFEYAATLGIIDVAYREPQGARDDFLELCEWEEMDCLSLYDGLAYFRITPLGAYCLGSADDYALTPVQPQVRFSVLPSLHVHVAGGRMSAEEALILDTWCEKETTESWRLDRQKTMRAIEKGHDIAELRAFLQDREEQVLPEPVESFLNTAQKQGRALKVIGTALLIQCDDEQTAALLATRKETAGLCLRAGDRQLVVRLEHEEKFRTLVRSLGFGIAV